MSEKCIDKYSKLISAEADIRKVSVPSIELTLSKLGDILPETQDKVNSLLQLSPDDFEQHYNEFISSILEKLAYNYKASDIVTDIDYLLSGPEIVDPELEDFSTAIKFSLIDPALNEIENCFDIVRIFELDQEISACCKSKVIFNYLQQIHAFSKNGNTFIKNLISEIEILMNENNLSNNGYTPNLYLNFLGVIVKAYYELGELDHKSIGMSAEEYAILLEILFDFGKNLGHNYGLNKKSLH